MVMVGRLVGTFEPALVMVAIAQANSASASTNTIPPIQPAGTDAGMNGNDTTHCRVSPTSTASAHAIGGRTMTWAVSAVSRMAGPVKTCARFDVCLLKTPLNPCGTMLRARFCQRALGEHKIARRGRQVNHPLAPPEPADVKIRPIDVDSVETEQNPNCGNSLVKSRVETDNSGMEPGADCGWRSIADEGTAFTRKNSPSRLGKNSDYR